MSEPEIPPVPQAPEADPAPEAPAESGAPRPRRRWPWLAGAALALLALALATAGYWASSPAFENLVRLRLIKHLQTATGGRVEIRTFHWRLSQLEAEAQGVVIHGLEDASERPYASIGRLSVKASVLGFWSPRILLRSLEIDRPVFHLIFYRDGTTNQPHPRRPQTSSKSSLDTLFDLKAGRLAVSNGLIDLDNRADKAIDFEERQAPLDFQAAEFSLALTYLPPANGAPESYRIRAGADGLNLLRGGTAPWAQHAQGNFQATLDLLRDSAYLRSFTLQSGKHMLELTGALENFSRPRWHAALKGELDLALIEPISGFPRTPVGLARMDLAAAGQDGQFHIDGPLHVTNGSYIDEEDDIRARAFDLDGQLHADPSRMLVSSVVIRPYSGGQLTGEVNLSHWLTSVPGAPQIQSSTPQGIAKKQKAAPSKEPEKPAAPAARPLSREGTPIFLPIDGIVNAQFHDISLDTLLDWLSEPPYTRLGLDALLNGPAWSTWQRGDDHTLVIGGNFAVSPSAHPVDHEAPSTGHIEATYTHKDGVVALHNLDLQLPATHIAARGHMSVDPIAGPANLAVDLQSRNLYELDAILRALELERKNEKGAAALPAALPTNASGQLDFHGNWTGSLIDPHLAGSMFANNIAIEMPTDKNPTQMIHWDALSAQGTYTATRISVEHGRMRLGQAEIEVDGVINTPHAPDMVGHAPLPTFDETSVLRMKLRANKLPIQELRPFFELPDDLTGDLNAMLDTDGPAGTLAATGWIELMDGKAFGEPFHRIHAQGKLADQVARVTQMTVTHAAGTLTATGSYDLNKGQFQIHARGVGLDLARIATLKQANLPAAGSLTFTLDGAGTQDDPQLQARASLDKLALNGEQLGSLDFTAHTANRTAYYQMTSRLDSAKLEMNGQTALAAPNQTSAKLEFSHLNIDALLRMAHIPGLNGDSALAGSVTLDGPLSDPTHMRGEARLQQLAATIDGVHLQSPGGLHATLSGGRIVLDPLHITGENTDLNLQANFALDGQRPINLAASGSINLKLAESIDPDLTASGSTSFEVEAHGPLANPEFKGRFEFRDGALSLGDLPNGLSQIRGTLEFNRNRLEVRSLTAMTGGGQLRLAGYVAYQNGLYADLTATGNAIRIRYPQGVSSQADANLHLQGQQNNLLLSGNVLLTRFAISPELDVAALAAQANAVRPTPSPNAPSNHIRLDVQLSSSPQLNFQNAYAKLAGNVDLRLRGTLASPSLLGRVSVTEGSAMIAGTRYDLERGEIYFTNPVRIQPTIDLSATARVEDFDITLGVHGTSDKLNVSYRSDPPLPEADVVALLALGRTQNQQRLYTQQQQQSISNPTTDALLGGALNATVSSRVQKLFGVGSVKVDPNYLGAMGASTSRVIVEEQLGPYVSLTYATNTNSTAQQLLQAEIAVNRHVSVLVSRDEAGVFSMVLKATRRYR